MKIAILSDSRLVCRDLEIAYRYSDGDPARLPALAAELVRLKPDAQLAWPI
jgi:hypothetical protein